MKEETKKELEREINERFEFSLTLKREDYRLKVIKERFKHSDEGIVLKDMSEMNSKLMQIVDKQMDELNRHYLPHIVEEEQDEQIRR